MAIDLMDLCDRTDSSAFARLYMRRALRDDVRIERRLTREEIAKGLTNDPETQRILSMTDEELAS